MVRTFKDYDAEDRLVILTRETTIAVDVEEAKELRTALTDFVEEQALKSVKDNIGKLFWGKRYSKVQAEILRNHFADELEMVIVR